MWPVVAITALAALVFLHFWWKNRFAHLQLALHHQREETARLNQDHERAISRELAQQKALFNSMVEGVLLLDKDGRIQLINQALERLFGLQSDIRGLTILEAFRSLDLQQLLKRVAIEGQVQGFEMETTGSHTEGSLGVNGATFFNSDGQQQGTILIFHDLTRLRQLENTRKEFVANVSHELRTPLSLIKGYVETLIDGARNDPVVSMRFLHIIEKHADRLTYLIEDLLTISRLESRQIVFNFENEELRPIVERVLEDLASRARDKHVKLENEVPADMTVRADADRLEQVLFNLVDNAIKYGHTGGEIKIKARIVDASLVEVCVCDDGPGIPAESVQRVFERFYRVDRARSRDQGGTGLGLAIVKHIVQSHGGDVWVKSELGEGAAFYFSLMRES